MPGKLPAPCHEPSPDDPVEADASPQDVQQEDSPVNQVSMWIQENVG